jgi:hypothetical protein
MVNRSPVSQSPEQLTAYRQRMADKFQGGFGEGLLAFILDRIDRRRVDRLTLFYGNNGKPSCRKAH